MLNSGAATAAITSDLSALPRGSIDAGARPDRWRFYALLLLALSLVLAQGCASLKRNPLPEDLYDVSQIPGIPDGRYWGDEAPPYAKDLTSMSREELRARYPALVDHPITLLAISGGGSDGAFTAGLVNGWSDAGTRPEFSMVTGISTGSLAAPFVFLGSAYDAKLKDVFTTISDKDIFKMRGKLAILTSDAVADNAPLRATVAQYIDEAMMEDIAEEHRRGRILLIGTTNLDAERPVVWNIGKIAASGAPGALDVIRDVMVASTAVPLAFPPMMMEVEANGERYDEMHVDGGVSRQSFLFSFTVDNKALVERLGAAGQTRVYVIRNAKLLPKWKKIDRKVIDIAARSTDSMIRTQGIGDLYREYLGSIVFGFDYNLAYIPDSFDEEPKEGTGFDPEYMNKLYQLGYDLAKGGYPWIKEPKVVHAR
jgi:predicted patatin/cPLA2 family phospholipase